MALWLRTRRPELERHGAIRICTASGAAATSKRPSSGRTNTLVIKTTNFTNRTSFEGSREALKMIERFTRTDTDLLMYRATFEDPTVFTQPWTIEIPLTMKNSRENQIFEAACHEGNYAMTGILAGARVRDQAVTTKRSK